MSRQAYSSRIERLKLEQEQKVLREHEIYLMAVKTARSKISHIESSMGREILTEIYIFGRLPSDIFPTYSMHFYF